MARDFVTELWLPVVGYEDRYAVSSMGRVRALVPYRSTTGILAGDTDKQGYRRVLLSRDGQKKRFSVHRLVCRAFHGEPPENTECRHLNGINTDDSASNLAWGTRSENMMDRVRHGTHNWGDDQYRELGDKHPGAKWSDDQVSALRADADAGMTTREIGQKYGMDRSYAYKLKHGLRRKGGRTPSSIHSDRS